MKNVYYHNPRCRKSREGLRLLEQHKIDFDIIEYLKSPPSEEELGMIIDKLGLRPFSLIRTQEKLFKKLNLSKKDIKKDEEWIKIMVKNPILIERPLLIYNNLAALGRPPEKLLEIIF
jgi:arsenate reductase